MSFAKYIKEKIIYIILILFGTITSEILLIPFNIIYAIRIYIGIIPIIILLISLLIEYYTKNKFYKLLRDRLNELDENTLQNLITLPNGIQISFRKYCEEYIFNNMDRYREITLDNGETILAGEMIRRTLKQMQDNNEIIQETSQKHK